MGRRGRAVALLEASCHSYLLQTAARSTEVEVGLGDVKG